MEEDDEEDSEEEGEEDEKEGLVKVAFFTLILKISSNFVNKNNLVVDKIFTIIFSNCDCRIKCMLALCTYLFIFTSFFKN